ncbi:MAG TPA: YfbR-like 5'-deoxynucleotidase, partial [Bacillota bacterium]|nr:YfbR-like 5'-deoxynucleotidase [Bacillota bacterium]
MSRPKVRQMPDFFYERGDQLRLVLLVGFDLRRPVPDLVIISNLNQGDEEMSHFFAYMARMKHIQRWGLMRNTMMENIQEHSLQVAMIAHCLALIKNRFFDGKVNPEKVAVLGMYHEASEV